MISMLGNAVSGFAIGLLVLDYTKSTLLYSVFLVMYNLPKIIVPVFAGPFLDRFSRKRVLYTLDFMSAGIYFCFFLFIKSGLFNYWVFLMVTIMVGTIDGTYSVAYDSFYPNLVSKGNFSKAYSISSLIYPLSVCMVPVASFVYKAAGSAAPLFIFNAVTFFVTACFEMSIDYNEKHIAKDESTKFNFANYVADFGEGLNYIMGEKGLRVITTYFCITMFASSGTQTLLLPFFKNHPQNFVNVGIDVVTLYAIVGAIGVFGRLIGGIIHYRFKYPTEKKFAIALFVYTTITILDASELYLPLPLMMLSFFTVGILGVTSFNIRISATQSYLPDTKRGRFNGTFQMICAAGTVVGQILSGMLGEIMDERWVIILMMSINMLAVYFVMYRGREHVKKVYNRSI
jgi:MFS family permease